MRSGARSPSAEQQAKKATHEQRLHQKQVGREGVEAEREGARRRAEEARRLEQTRTRARADTERSSSDTRALHERVDQIVATGRVKIRFGHRRYYFDSHDGRVPYLAMDDEAADQLDRGAVAIAQAPDGDVVLIDRQAAARVRDLDASWIRLWINAAPTDDASRERR